MVTSDVSVTGAGFSQQTSSRFFLFLFILTFPTLTGFSYYMMLRAAITGVISRDTP